MGQENIGIRFPPTEEERDGLFIGLLREWWISAVDGLVETVGEDAALKALRPYCKLMGGSGWQKLRSVTGNPANDAPDIQIFMLGTLTSAIGGGKARIWSDEPTSSIGEISDCIFNGRNKIACYSMCELIPHSGVEESNPDFEQEMVESITWGNRTCRWRTMRKGKKSTIIPKKEVDIPSIKHEMMSFVAFACLGEMWANATRALIDISNPDYASKILLPRMRSSGNDFGEKFQNDTKEAKRDENGFFDTIVLMNDLNRRKGRYKNGTSIDGEIEECPFSGSPPEICLQYESFFNGVCDAINPEYEFAYDRMMSKGDQTCHWVVRKKGEATKEKPKVEATLDNPVKRLTNKFIDGEITEEEFRKKLIVLEEFKFQIL